MAARPFDPATLVALAQRHRIESLVQHGLVEAGVALAPGPAAELRSRARDVQFTALANAGEEVRLAVALAGAGIDSRFLKGATLAIMAYGAIGLKASTDIDVLVHPRDWERAAAVLRSLGYRLDLLDGVQDDRRVRRYTAGQRETNWKHPARARVDLHTDLTGHPGVLPIEQAFASAHWVPTPGGDVLPTLPPPLLFDYLAAHGLMHGWSRLKWLADAGALLARHPEALRTQPARGAARSRAVVLALLARWLNAPELPVSPARDRRAVLTLQALSERQLVFFDPADPEARAEDHLAGVVRLQRIWLLLRAGGTYRLLATWRRIAAPYHRHHLAVPRWALRPFMLAWLPLRLVSRPIRIRQRARLAQTASTP